MIVLYNTGYSFQLFGWINIHDPRLIIDYGYQVRITQ